MRRSLEGTVEGARARVAGVFAGVFEGVRGNKVDAEIVADVLST
jgi:hypothetical protein